MNLCEFEISEFKTSQGYIVNPAKGKKKMFCFLKKKIQAQAAAKKHICVYSPNIAGVCDDVHPQSMLPPKVQGSVAILVSEGHAATRALPIWLACTANWGHEYLWTQSAVEAHIWVLSSAASGLCVDVHGPCYHSLLERQQPQFTPAFLLTFTSVLLIQDLSLGNLCLYF